MKCVLIGYGYWGKIIEKYIEKDNFFELIGICDPKLENSLNFDNILKNKDIECAFVCNPVDVHYLTVKRLLEHDKHVFCEKPLCKDLKETEEVLELSKKKKKCLFTDYIYTSSPSINFIKENINLLGKVLYCEGNINQFGKFYKKDNVFEVLSVHLISAISYILDKELRVVDVISKKESKDNITQVGSIEILIEKGTKEKINGIINSSLLNDKKERNIIFRCENGNIIFDMMGKETVKIVRHKELEIGYQEEVIFTKKYDESNNLIKVIDLFKKNIKKKETNRIVTINVAKAFESISKKLKEKSEYI